MKGCGEHMGELISAQVLGGTQPPDGEAYPTGFQIPATVISVLQNKFGSAVPTS